MQSKKFVDATVSPKFNWGKIKDQAQHQVQVVKSTAAKIKGKLKAKKITDETVSHKFNWNEGLSTVGDTLKGIFRKPDTYVTNTYVQPEEEDNTMLYVGIGGAVLLVVILMVVMLKK